MVHKAKLTFEVEPVNLDQTLDLSQIITYEQETEFQIDRTIKVRLDKWLWAARFFKTRPLARAAIEQGKILYDGQKAIPTKEIEIGATVIINLGRNKKAIVIRALSTRRRNLEEADALYEEVDGIYTNNVMPAPPAHNSITDSQQDFASKPKKAVRYLRRAMGIGDSSSVNRKFEHKDSSD